MVLKASDSHLGRVVKKRGNKKTTSGRHTTSPANDSKLLGISLLVLKNFNQNEIFRKF